MLCDPPSTLAAFLATLRAQALAARTVDTLEARTQRVRGRTLRLRPRAAHLATTTTPLLLDLLTIAGGTAAPAHPDVVILMSPGTRLPEALREATTLCTRFPATEDLFVADGELLATPPDARIVEALEVLACCLHPAHFPDLAERRAARFARIR